jgi:Na+-transporting NADH:ubiquinone oxidoreductase subunit A
MISVNIKNSFDLKISGAPSDALEVLAKPTHVAVLPQHIPFVKPRLKVQVGDKVKVGTPLFEDKRNPDLKFLSPGGGEVARIEFGPRRVIQEIVVVLDEDEQYETFDGIGRHAIGALAREDLTKAMMAGGVWPFVRTLPFRDIADPEKIPPALFVCLDTLEPFHPLSKVYLKGETELLQLGLEILARLSPKVIVAAAQANSAVLEILDGRITHRYSGVYPADDPGTLLYHLKKGPEENAAWYIYGQDVLHLARLFKFGRYPTERIVVLGGNAATDRKHFRTRAGLPLRHISQGRMQKGAVRHIVGGIFKGYRAASDGYLGFYETALNLLPVGEEVEILGFMRPGFNKPSHSSAFLSGLRRSELDVDCNLHGEERACVNCGYCTEVCAVDILPQFTLKCLLADELEEALAHGLLDCVQCGLCSYVCPSKIELAGILTKFKGSYYLEK